MQRLKLERAAIGYYVSGHPLERYQDELAGLTTGTLGNLRAPGGRAEMKFGCVVTSVRERPLKSGAGRMAFVAMEDLTGVAEMLVSARDYESLEPVFRLEVPLLVCCAVSTDRLDDGSERVRLRCRSAKTLSDARRERTKKVVVSLEDSVVNEAVISSLKATFREFPGECAVKMCVCVPEAAEVALKLPADVKVAPEEQLLERVEQLLGPGVVRFEA